MNSKPNPQCPRCEDGYKRRGDVVHIEVTCYSESNKAWRHQSPHAVECPMFRERKENESENDD